MDDLVKIFCSLVGAILIIACYAIYTSHDTTVKAIAAGLQECALHNPEQVVWQKECK